MSTRIYQSGKELYVAAAPRSFGLYSTPIDTKESAYLFFDRVCPHIVIFGPHHKPDPDVLRVWLNKAAKGRWHRIAGGIHFEYLHDAQDFNDLFGSSF